MFVHPEMRDEMNKAMEEGLKHWRSKSPEEIRSKLHSQTLADQKALMPGNVKHGLAFRMVPLCDCAMMYFGHAPWCERKTRTEFFTPKPEDKKPNPFYKPWIYGGYAPELDGEDEGGI